MMDLEFWATTDVGRVRDHNEDNFLVDKRMHLFVVCDGMGGHAAGEVASAMSVQIVREVLSEHREVFDRLEQDPDHVGNRKSVLTLIDHAISEACARIYREAQADLAKKGMGTTCSLLLLAEGRGFIGHVGDSRIYLYRENHIHMCTEDHSLVNEMIRLGKIKRGEEHNLPHKNAVTRAVGVNEFVEVDTREFDVFGGDSFLLCSDGLSGYFKDDSQIAHLVDQEDIKKITQDCIDFANAGGGKDNITAILVRVRGEEKQEDVQEQIDVMRAAPYFQYLSQKELLQLAKLAEVERVESGPVYGEGDDPGCLRVVMSGKVRLFRDDATLATLSTGDHFGETSLIDETAQAVGAEALEDSAFLVFNRDRFMELLRSDTDLAVKLLWNFLQTFTIRMRRAPYEMLVGQSAKGGDELTPPSGTLAFEEDRREGHQPASVSGEFVEAPEPAMEETVRSAGVKPVLDPTVKATAVKPVKATAVKPVKAAMQSAAKTARVDQKEKPAASKQVSAEPTQKLDVKHTARSSAEKGAEAKQKRETAKTLPSRPMATELGMKATIDPDKTVPDSGLGALAWDEIIPPDLLEDEESLRKTVSMDRDPDTTGPMGSMEDLRKTVPSGDGGLGKPISGESTTKSITPRAQVLKRTKLVVGDDSGEFDARESTRTRDVKPLKSRKPDATLELEIDDDNVEELN